ncbi:hypothetical protein L1049_010405 [Liquidambar formosana]|uniref:Uncharacterized protein n=1 Tax=Liquidambar formosana TaxID=63359 RepID=A0AAP0N8G5_LIQFO
MGKTTSHFALVSATIKLGWGLAPRVNGKGFRWAIDNAKWQGRIDSIKPLFEESRADLGKNEIDKEVVEKEWDRIAPGLAMGS